MTHRSSKLFLLCLAAGCGSVDYGVAPIQADVASPVSPGEAIPAVEEPPQLVEVPAWIGDGAAVEVWEDPNEGVRKEVFTFGATVDSPITDFLFVVDDSVSMTNVIEQFQQGFDTLADGDVFPSKAQIAVMTMLPADPKNLQRLHPAVQRSPGMNQNPGFVHLIDESRIKQFRNRSRDRVRQRVTDQGCAPWFAPGEATPTGSTCLNAHTQLSLTHSRTEAGLTAFKQLLLKNEGTSIFRSGAAVNVIFVSDTHDPGFLPPPDDQEQQDAFADLLALQPDFLELQDLVQADNLVASFRVHAIAPRSQCSERWEGLEEAYFKVAEDSGGVSADICTLADYGEVIEQISETGAKMQDAVFALGSLASEVSSVEVDGRPVSWSLGAEGGAIVLDADIPKATAELEIVYRKAPHSSIRSRPNKVR